MDTRNLMHAAKVVRVLNRSAGAASATPTKAAIVDTQGFDAVTFIAGFQDVLDTADIALRAAAGPANDTGQMTLLAGASIGAVASASSMDNKLLVLELNSLPHRYVEAQVLHQTANAPIDFVIAILHEARRVPVTQDASVAGAKLVDSPATV